MSKNRDLHKTVVDSQTMTNFDNSPTLMEIRKMVDDVVIEEITVWQRHNPSESVASAERLGGQLKYYVMKFIEVELEHDPLFLEDETRFHFEELLFEVKPFTEKKKGRPTYVIEFSQQFSALIQLALRVEKRIKERWGPLSKTPVLQ